MNMGKSIAALFKNNPLVTKARCYQKRPTLFHLNEPQPIKVSSHFTGHYYNGIRTQLLEDETYELKMAMKMLHFSPKYRKKWYE